ncbi:MAG: transporter [Flavobacterium sp.]|nr:transporter [Flavobacterium sp.]
MKKYISIFMLIFSFTIAFAQEVNDGIRLAQTNLNGTARFQAMSGAFGSLGGDFSAINVNPAGSAIFNNNQWSVSLSDNIIKNSTNYFGTKTNSDKNSVVLNQAAVVFVFDNYSKSSDWNKFTLGVNYENTGNFQNDVFSAGTNQNSIANYFLSYANANGNIPGIKLGALQNYYFDELNFQDQQAKLGFEAYVFNAIPLASDPTNYNNSNIQSYSSNVRQGGNYHQENSYATTGYNGKVNFNVGAQYDKWLSLGLNLNSHFTDYKQSTSFFETNSNTLDNTIRVKDIRFNNDIHTFGSGFSLQLGAIAKVNSRLRLGLSYESPTWYSLNDELTQSLTAVSASTAGVLPRDVVDPKIINTYEPYTIRTPSKWTASGSVIFAKKGLLSLDVATKDYTGISFGPKSKYFDNRNNQINNLLDRTFEYRLGGEYRIKNFSLRGGYRFEQSPYKNKKTIGDLYGISTGLGYSWGYTKLDVSYAYAKRNLQNQFFSQGLTDFSSTTAINNNVTVTLVFEL